MEQKYEASLVKINTGDTTVLVKSATINDVHDFEINASHGDLLKNNDVLEELFSILNIGTPPPTTPFHTIQSVLSFILHSPAEMTITDPNNNQAGFNVTGNLIDGAFYDETAKILLIPNPQSDPYRVDILGTGSGEYELSVIQTPEHGESQFYQVSLPTDEGKEETLMFDFAQDDQPLIDEQGGLLYLRSAETKITLWINDIATSQLKFYQKRLIKFWLNRAIKLIEQTKTYIANQQTAKAGHRIKESAFAVYKANRLLKLWDNNQLDQSQIIAIDLQAAFELNNQCLCNRRTLQKRLELEEKKLEQIDKKYQRLADNGKPISPETALTFQEATDLLANAKQALTEDKLPRTAFLEFRLGMAMLELRR